MRSPSSRTSAARRRGPASLVALVAFTAGCATVPLRDPSHGEPASPLGPSFVLAPAPSDDDALLGRIIVAPPEAGASLEDVSRPNPCADALEPARASAMVATFEDAQDLSLDGSGRALLGAYGFASDVTKATHFFYRVTTERRVARVDTVAYETCCREKSCGLGYVSALV